MTITPDLALDELNAEDSAMLILPGADTWLSGGNAAFAKKARQFLDAGVPVAADLRGDGRARRRGLLDDRLHTSNAPRIHGGLRVQGRRPLPRRPGGHRPRAHHRLGHETGGVRPRGVRGPRPVHTRSAGLLVQALRPGRPERVLRADGRGRMSDRQELLLGHGPDRVPAERPVPRRRRRTGQAGRPDRGPLAGARRGPKKPLPWRASRARWASRARACSASPTSWPRTGWWSTGPIPRTGGPSWSRPPNAAWRPCGGSAPPTPRSPIGCARHWAMTGPPTCTGCSGSFRGLGGLGI